MGTPYLCSFEEHKYGGRPEIMQTSGFSIAKNCERANYSPKHIFKCFHHSKGIISCVKIIYIFKTENAITLKTCTEVYF